MTTAASTDRRCRGCGQWLPLTEFHARRANRDGIDTQCRRCRTAQMRDRTYYEGRERCSAQRYTELYTQQGGLCASCKGDGGSRKLHVDHDPRTGKVRALLCGPCNQGLGNFKDDPVRLRAALRYLRRHGVT